MGERADEWGGGNPPSPRPDRDGAKRLSGPVDAVKYLAFVGVAVCIPVVVVTAVAQRRGGLRTRRPLFGILALTAIAVGYTFAWDGILIKHGVWWYGPAVVTARIWVVPLGELAFIFLQTVLVVIFTIAVTPDFAPATPRRGEWRIRLVGVGCIAVLAVLGGALLTVPSGLYLGAILVWASPPLALLWFLGGPVFRRHPGRLAVSILGPVCYLSIVDTVAIQHGLWHIASQYSTTITVHGLPIEEVTFFLCTNTLLVFGFTLYRWVAVRCETVDAVEGLRGLIPLRSTP